MNSVTTETSMMVMDEVVIVRLSLDLLVQKNLLQPNQFAQELVHLNLDFTMDSMSVRTETMTLSMADLNVN